MARLHGYPHGQGTQAGMTHTRWRDDYTRLVPGLAQAYRRAPDGWHLDMPNDNVIAAGGMLTTVRDWLRWNEALTNKTLGAAVTDSLTRQMRLNNGLEIHYALGLMVNRYRGTLEISHSGNTNGYSTNLARYPELGPLSIAVLCNYAGANAIGFTHQLVTALAASSLAPVPSPDTVATDHAALRAWRGLYEHGWYHTTTVLDTAGGQLRSGAQPLRALQGGTYAMDGQRVRLAVDAAGTRTIRMATADGDSIVLTRRAESRWVPTTAELAQLAGRYRSEEIDITFTVAVDGNRLTVSPRPGVRTVLRPTWRDAFDGSGESVWFTRDPKGRVTAMHFGAGRVWDFVSKRIP